MDARMWHPLKAAPYRWLWVAGLVCQIAAMTALTITAIAVIESSFEEANSLSSQWFAFATIGTVASLTGALLNGAARAKAPANTETESTLSSLVSLIATAAAVLVILESGWSRVASAPVHDATAGRLDVEWTPVALLFTALLFVGVGVLARELMPNWGMRRSPLVRSAWAAVAVALSVGSALVMVKIPDPTMTPAIWASLLWPVVLLAVMVAVMGRWLRADIAGSAPSLPFARDRKDALEPRRS
ncbi:hypothetical protein [Dermacoccus sp. Tok2021]|uniref:hypothetical protein n=1 Tax=Dermacoccus sp. Tok2021 TaxID=2826873 RepID=UPI001CA7AE6B|nr:hypothetical protein [Dermacoccus sp. Tok2021]MBZ4497944.1 hypothetical protein [Dermacoccus sp. Tok2021]